VRQAAPSPTTRRDHGGIDRMSNPTQPVNDDNQPHGRRRRGFWRCFLIAFSLTFIGTGLFWPRYFFNGISVYKTNLLNYYLLEIRQTLNSSSNLGPTSGNFAALLKIASIHILLSALAGAVIAGMVRLILRRWRNHGPGGSR
jgi:hypothetical protein